MCLQFNHFSPGHFIPFLTRPIFRFQHYRTFNVICTGGHATLYPNTFFHFFFFCTEISFHIIHGHIVCKDEKKLFNQLQKTKQKHTHQPSIYTVAYREVVCVIFVCFTCGFSHHLIDFLSGHMFLPVSESAQKMRHAGLFVCFQKLHNPTEILWHTAKTTASPTLRTVKPALFYYLFLYLNLQFIQMYVGIVISSRGYQRHNIYLKGYSVLKRFENVCCL